MLFLVQHKVITKRIVLEYCSLAEGQEHIASNNALLFTVSELFHTGGIVFTDT